ncbi:hypothetical protein [Hyphomicrobium sp. D-2]|nr:hypothetical protein [Hyphomicrobium sp. D-2]MDH4982616.1 hypothetical protein [Hyphomicrobium sp. D-2]
MYKLVAQIKQATLAGKSEDAKDNWSCSDMPLLLNDLLLLCPSV